MKLRRNIGTTIASCGVAMLLFGVGTLPVHGAERPTVAMQPSPRPAIDPVGQNGGGASVKMGHVTGTVIDQRTGAPVAGVAVKIGDEVVTTDANGNYDHWVPVGSYPVELSLAADQGVPAQGTVMVDVQPDAATVQHLNFASPAPAVPTAVPTAAVPTPVPSPAAPAAAAQPVVAARQPAIKAPKPAVESPPNRLPRTADNGAAAWLWMACGMLLLMAGGVVGFAPVLGGRSAAALLRAQAANSALLQSLLAQPPVDEFLAALFASHERKRN